MVAAVDQPDLKDLGHFVRCPLGAPARRGDYNLWSHKPVDSGTVRSLCCMMSVSCGAMASRTTSGGTRVRGVRGRAAATVRVGGDA